MATRTIRTLAFEEVLNPVAKSFLDADEGRAIDWSRSAIRQLYDRVDEWGASPHKNAARALISDQRGEFDCLAICNSGISDFQLMPGNSMLPLIGPPTSGTPV
jgi:hypothetical protein